VEEQFAAKGWSFRTIEEACAELEALAGQARVNFAKGYAAASRSSAVGT
jgi:hypothetical protein